MRLGGWRAAAIVAAVAAGFGATGCSNWQGTSADPDLVRESVDYKNNDDPQNTGAGAGAVGKPPEGPSSNMSGDSASQAAVKGTAPTAAGG